MEGMLTARPSGGASVRLVVAAAAFCVLALAVSAPAAQAGPEPAPVVTIGSDTAMPGGAVLIPLSLKLPSGVEAVGLSLEIPVPQTLVKLKEVRLSLASEMAGAKASAELKDSSPGEAAQPTGGSGETAKGKPPAAIHVSIAGKQPLPSGTVATLDLRIADETGPTTGIRLK